MTIIALDYKRFIGLKSISDRYQCIAIIFIIIIRPYLNL